MQVQVSVLMPARDAARTLPVALRSVLRSRAVALEVVAVDHGSVDGTGAILRRFAARDDRVRVLEAPAAVALPDALELGRAACRAPLIARMDADDVMHPDRLAAHMARLAARADLAAVASRVKLIPRNRTTAGLRAYVAWQNAALSVDDHARDVWIEQPLCQPATTFRADVLHDVGGWRSSEAPEDYDLYLRLVVAGHGIEKLPAVHHAWRQHESSTSRYSRDAFAARKARALVERFRVHERALVVAGAGKEGGRIGRALLAVGARPRAFVDVATRRIGRVRHGAEIVDTARLPELVRAWPDVFVVAAVGTSGARGVVRGQLAAAGLVEGETFVCVA